MATITWLSGIAGDWSTAADWSSGTVPGSGDDVTINSSGTYVVTVSTTEAANSLTLNAAGATLAVTGVLADSGALAVTKGSFLVENSGSVTVGGAVTDSGTFGLDGSSKATITGGFINSTNLSLDSNFEDGGGALTVDGTLSNTGTVQFGNTSLGAVSGTGMTVTLGGLTAPVGSVFVVDGGSQKATLAFLNGGTGFASNSGSVELSDIAALTLNNTFTNNGTQFKLDGYSALTITGGFINSTNLSLDSNFEDGGGALTVDGTLSNTGTVQFGNTSLGAVSGTGMTVTLGGLTAPVGSVFVVDGGSQKATLAFLNGGTGFASNSGSVELSDIAALTLNNTFTNNGTQFKLDGYSALTITGGFINSTNLSLDSNFEDGGGALTIDGTLSNTGTVQFGNTSLGAVSGTGMTVTLGGLTAPVGSVFVVDGGSQKATLAFLNGGTGFASNSGSVELSDIAALTLNNTFTNNGTQFKLDGYSALTITGGFINSTNLSLDSNFEDGGGALTVDGTLSNTGTVQFGNTSLGAVSGTGMTVTLGGLTAPVGSVFVVDGGSQKATLAFLNGGTGFASNSGSVELSDIAALTLNNTFTNNGTQFKLDGYSALTITGGFINSTNLSLDSNFEDGGGALTVDGTLSNTGTVQFGNTSLGAVSGTGMTVTLGGLTAPVGSVFVVDGGSQKATLAFLNGGTGFASNSGSVELSDIAALTLNNTFTNNGTQFKLDGYSALTITGGFINSTNLSLDSNFEDGGGALTIDGTLSNTGTVQFGNTSLGAVSGTGMTVTLGGLTAPVGSVFVVDGGSQKATLAFLNGGTGFASNSGSVELSDIAALTLNNTFTNNGTQFKLDGYSALTITGGFINSTNLSLDSNFEDGGGALTVDGTLSNTGTVQFGNTSLGAVSGTGLTVTLGGLTAPVGSVFVVDGGSQKATLAFLNGGTGFASNSGSVELSDIAALTLNNTFTNNGTQFKLDGYSALTITGGFINSTNLSLDSNFEDGGGALTIDGTLSNTGTVQFGNTSLGAVSGTGMTVTLGGLTNSASAVFDANGGPQKAIVTITGQASNSAKVNISSSSSLAVSGVFTQTQTAGTTTVQGAFSAASIDIFGGLLAIDTSVFANATTLWASTGGVIDFTSGGLTNLSSGTLTGGVYEVDANSTMKFASAATLITDDADIILTGTDSVIESGTTLLTAELTSIGTAGALHLFSGASFNSATSFVDNGLIDLNTGTFTAGSLTIASTGTIHGSGTVAAPVTNNGIIDAANGSDLDVTTAISGTGQLQIETGSELELGGATAEAATYEAATGKLRIDNTGAANYTGTINGFAGGDILELANLNATSVTPGTFNGTTTALTVNLSGGGTLTYILAGNYSTDSFQVTHVNGNADSDITVTPKITAPGTVTVGINQTNPVTGISISETPTPAGETFTVVLADAIGLLTATGPGVSGSNTTVLTITGSLSQVNSDLATLKDTDGISGSDTIAVNATDSFGNVATQQTIAVTVNGLPVIAVPGAKTIGVSKVAAIAGIILSETGNTATSGETFTATVTDSNGLLSATGPANVSGSGTKTLIITGSLSQVNNDLTTLMDTNGTTGSDTITLNATDSFGNAATKQTIAVTVNGLPAIAAPGAQVLEFGEAATIAGVSLSETGNTATSGETFNATVTDSNGLLSATGPANVSGSGTKTLIITGSLSQVNSDLTTLMDTDRTSGSDTITLNVTDSFGNAATKQTIAALVTPVYEDFTGDGTSDILWYNATTGDTGYWLMSSAAWQDFALKVPAATGYTIVGVGDFNGDGTADILWQNTSTGDTGAWLTPLGGGQPTWDDLGTVSSSTGYSVVGVGDFAGNGTDDILWRNAATADTGYWAMSDGKIAGWIDLGAVPTEAEATGAGDAPTDYNVVGVGDFTGNGISDILLQSSTNGDTGIFLLNGKGQNTWLDLGPVTFAYPVVGIGDFNGDGIDDILFRDGSTGDTGYWEMNSSAQPTWVDLGTVSTAYSVIGVGDFTGNGISDILWRDSSTGDTGYWAMNSSGKVGGWVDLGTVSPTYTVPKTV